MPPCRKPEIESTSNIAFKSGANSHLYDESRCRGTLIQRGNGNVSLNGVKAKQRHTFVSLATGDQMRTYQPLDR